MIRVSPQLTPISALILKINNFSYTTYYTDRFSPLSSFPPSPPPPSLPIPCKSLMFLLHLRWSVQLPEARKKIIVIKRHAHEDYVEKCKRINHTLYFHTPFHFAKAGNYISSTFIPFVYSNFALSSSLLCPTPSPTLLCISLAFCLIRSSLLSASTFCSHAVYLIIIRVHLGLHTHFLDTYILS